MHLRLISFMAALALASYARGEMAGSIPSIPSTSSIPKPSVDGMDGMEGVHDMALIPAGVYEPIMRGQDEPASVLTQ